MNFEKYLKAFIGNEIKIEKIDKKRDTREVKNLT